MKLMMPDRILYIIPEYTNYHFYTFYKAPNWPSGRIKLIIEDAKPSMFLTNTKVDLIYKAISDMENDSLVPPVHQVSLK